MIFKIIFYLNNKQYFLVRISKYLPTCLKLNSPLNLFSVIFNQSRKNKNIFNSKNLKNRNLKFRDNEEILFNFFSGSKLNFFQHSEFKMEKILFMFLKQILFENLRCKTLYFQSRRTAKIYFIIEQNMKYLAVSVLHDNKKQDKGICVKKSEKRKQSF